MATCPNSGEHKPHTHTRHDDTNRSGALPLWAVVPLTLPYALDMSGNPIYTTKRWKELRAQVIQDEPVCHWCRRAPSVQADHVTELDAGGDPYDRSGIVGSCASCNARRGAQYVNKKTANRIQQRNQTMTNKPPEKKKTETPFSFSTEQLTPSPHSHLSPKPFPVPPLRGGERGNQKGTVRERGNR